MKNKKIMSIGLIIGVLLISALIYSAKKDTGSASELKDQEVSDSFSEEKKEEDLYAVYENKYGDLDKIEEDIANFMENASFEDIYDEDGNKYRYLTLNQHGLAIPLPDGWRYKALRDTVFLISDENKHKNMELAIRVNQVKGEKDLTAATAYFYKTLPQEFFYNSTIGPIYPYIDNFGKGTKEIAVLGNPYQINVIPDAHYVYKENALKSIDINSVFGVTYLGDSMIFVSAIGEKYSTDASKKIVETIIKNIRENRITDIEKNFDTPIEFRDVSLSIPATATEKTFDRSTKKYILSSNPADPDYNIQIALLELNKGKYGDYTFEKAEDFPKTTVPTTIYKMLFNTPVENQNIVASMGADAWPSYPNLGKYSGMEYNYEIALSGGSLDNIGEIPEGTIFDTLLIEKKDSFVIINVNYADNQREIAEEYIEQIIYSLG